MKCGRKQKLNEEKRKSKYIIESYKNEYATATHPTITCRHKATRIREMFIQKIANEKGRIKSTIFAFYMHKDSRNLSVLS